MNFKPFDRLPILEWAGWWDKTIERWRGEGLPDVGDRYEICSYLGVEPFRQMWLRPRRAGMPVANRGGPPPVQSADDYERLLPHLYPSPESLTNEWTLWRQWAEARGRGELVLWITLEGFFWFPRTLLGIEGHLYAFYDEPELMHRMCSDLADWHLRIIDAINAIAPPDFMTFAEDMSYNHGPMLSQPLFEQFMAPYYQRVVPRLRESGTLVLVDSDGDVSAALPWFEAAGVQGLLPLERQAGVDLAELRRRHPQMRFIGHFDKMTMTRGEAAMRAEFERLLPIAAQGGYLISCDHQTPPGVSLDQYRVYLELFRDYAHKAGDMSQRLLADAPG